jgi:hypothetical protein
MTPLMKALQISDTARATVNTRSGLQITCHATFYGAPKGMIFYSFSSPAGVDMGDCRPDDSYIGNVGEWEADPTHVYNEVTQNYLADARELGYI